MEGTLSVRRCAVPLSGRALPTAAAVRTPMLSLWVMETAFARSPSVAGVLGFTCWTLLPLTSSTLNFAVCPTCIFSGAWFTMTKSLRPKPSGSWTGQQIGQWIQKMTGYKGSTDERPQCTCVFQDWPSEGATAALRDLEGFITNVKRVFYRPR